MINIRIQRPFQTFFEIETDYDPLPLLLVQKLGQPYISVEKQQAEHQIGVYRKGHSFAVTFKGESYETTDPIHEIDRLLFEHTRYDESVLALHGSAVAYQGGAYLFLASTGSGKTTLATYLTLNGFAHIADDCILLDRQSFTVYPYPEPIHLRAGGMEVLQQQGFMLNTLLLGERYIYTPQHVVDTPAPLRAIFFLERGEEENCCIPMDTNEKMTALMKAPITPYAVTPTYLRLLSRLAAYPAWHLRYSDMAYVAKCIREGVQHG